MAPGLEAPGGFGGLCGMRSRRGGTGGKDVWGGIDNGDGGLSTCKTQDKPMLVDPYFMYCTTKTSAHFIKLLKKLAVDGFWNFSNDGINVKDVKD